MMQVPGSQRPGNFYVSLVRRSRNVFETLFEYFGAQRIVFLHCQLDF